MVSLFTLTPGYIANTVFKFKAKWLSHLHQTPTLQGPGMTFFVETTQWFLGHCSKKT